MPLLRHRFLTLCAAFACLAAPLADHARAQFPIKVENVRVGFDEKAGGGSYKVGSWTPVWVDLQAGPERFRGSIDIQTLDEDGIPTLVRRPIDVPAGQNLFGVPALVFMGTRNAEVRVTPRNESGTPRGEAKLESNIDSFDRSQEIVLRLGNPSGLEGVAELGKYLNPAANQESELKILRTRVPDRLPGRGQGYDACTAIVLDTNDRAVLDALAGGAALALKEWVREGGHLLVAVGQNWQAVNDSELAEILPAQLAGQIRLADPRAIEAFAGNPKKKIPDAPIITRMENWEARGGIPLAAAASTPIVVRGAYGFGRVTLIGLNVDQAPFSQWEERHLFWDKALEIPGRYAQLAADAPLPGYQGFQANQDLGNFLHEELEQFPGVKLVPFGWVAFFVFLYILLIGPGDYFFLRKVLKRMELTWITFPLIVLVVSVLAYAAAYSLKGVSLRMSKSDIVDVDQKSGLVRGNSYFSLFSPQNRDYDIGLAPLAPDRSKDAPSFATTIDPLPAGLRLSIRNFGAANPMGGGFTALTGQGYRMLPDGESENLKAIRIPIWSTKGFKARWTGSGNPVLEADLVRAGPDRISGSVKNLLDIPLEDAVIVTGKQVYQLKTIPPGGTARVIPNESTSLSAYLERLSSRLPMARTRMRGGQAISDPNLRNDLLRVASFHAGLGTRQTSLENDRLGDLDLSGLAVDLKRPTLVAHLPVPVSTVSLNWNGNPPAVTHNTLIRVVLPPAGEEAESVSPPNQP
jgi:hypothetical protein